MSTSRPIALIALLLVSCAGWEEPTPSGAPAPDGRPVASQYAPPPPVRPSDTPPPLAPPAAHDFRVAIASVQLLEDCPDPAPAPAAVPEPSHAGQRAPAIYGDRAEGLRSACSQSSVQLALHSDIAAGFRVEAVRLLRAGNHETAGTALVRSPTTWAPDGTYQPWDQRVPAGAEIKVSYKLGQPAPARAGQPVPPSFDAYIGIFLLEMDVSVGGQRRTIRSAEFSLMPVEVMVT